jgi:hypothetical protein
MPRQRSPRVPPETRSRKSVGSDPDTKVDDRISQDAANIDQVGDRGNIRQNTSNQPDQR